MNKILIILSICFIYNLISAQEIQVYNAQAGAYQGSDQQTKQTQQPSQSGTSLANVSNAISSNNASLANISNAIGANSASNANNVFLENYARKGMNFKAEVYRKDSRNVLFKTSLGNNDLRKAIVIFFGDWCPHCSTFLTNFSKNINNLVSAGVKILFIAVPSIDRLQNWQNPSDQDYIEAESKLRGFGIQLNQSVELVLLGSNNTLNSNAIDSLPTLLAINNSKEQFRGGADNSIDKVNFTEQNSLDQFLQIWNSDEKQVNKKEHKESNNNSTKHKANSKVNVGLANSYTDMLNSGERTAIKKKVCHCTCEENYEIDYSYNYPQNTSKYLKRKRRRIPIEWKPQGIYNDSYQHDRKACARENVHYCNIKR